MSNLREITGSRFVAELVRLPSEELKDASSDEECIICRAEFGPETEDAVQLPCRHVFDRECLNGWLSEPGAGQNTCPKCRTELFVQNDDTPESNLRGFLAEYISSRPDPDITGFLDLIARIPADTAARLPLYLTILNIFSGLGENVTGIIHRQYSDWFARQTQEVKDRFPNPLELPIQAYDNSICELLRDFWSDFVPQREEEDEAAGSRLPDNNQFPQIVTPEDCERVLERIPGITEEHLNEYRRSGAELHAQRQRQAGVGSGANDADSSSASHNISPVEGESEPRQGRDQGPEQCHT